MPQAFVVQQRPCDFAIYTSVAEYRSEGPAPMSGDVLGDDARLYLRHVEHGETIRALAREVGCHASTILRRIRRFEARRDDPLVDSALAQKNTQPSDAVEKLLPWLGRDRSSECISFKILFRKLCSDKELNREHFSNFGKKNSRTGVFQQYHPMTASRCVCCAD